MLELPAQLPGNRTDCLERFCGCLTMAAHASGVYAN